MDLKDCCNPLRFFEAAKNDFDFSNIDSSYVIGEGSFSECIENVDVKMSVDVESDIEQIPIPLPIDQPRKMRKRILADDENFVEIEPSLHPLVQSSKKALKSNSTKPNAKIKRKSLFEEEASVSGSDEDDDGSSDEDSAVNSTNNELMNGIGDEFNSTDINVDANYFPKDKIADFLKSNLRSMPTSSCLMDCLKLCVDCILSKQSSFLISPFDCSNRQNHVPNDALRRYCDDIPRSKGMNEISLLNIIQLIMLLPYLKGCFSITMRTLLMASYSKCEFNESPINTLSVIRVFYFASLSNSLANLKYLMSSSTIIIFRYKLNIFLHIITIYTTYFIVCIGFEYY